MYMYKTPSQSGDFESSDAKSNDDSVDRKLLIRMHNDADGARQSYLLL